MIIIFAIFLITVFAQQHKYIDLLPDNEKQELLDNVARRIMESVVNYGTNKGNIELTDAQLNEHNDFVQSVMQEETAFKTRRNKRESRSSGEDKKSKENDDSKDGLEVKSFQFRNNDVDKLDTSANSAGLTATDLNRRNDNKIPQGNFTDKFKADVTENRFPLQTKSETRDIKSKETIDTSTIKILNGDKSKSTLYSKPQMQNSGPVKSNTETQKIKIANTTKTRAAASTASKTKLVYETTSETNVRLPVTVKSFIQDVGNMPTVSTTGNKIQILEYDSANNPEIIYLVTKRKNDQTYSDNHFELSSNATKFHTQDSINGTFKSFLTDGSATDSDKNTTTSEYENLPTTLNNQILTTQNKVQVNTATTENYSMVTKDRPEKERFTTNIPILTTRNIKEEQSTKNPKVNKLSKSIKQPENDDLVSYVASKALKHIKHELELKNIGNFVDNETKIKKGETHLNHYQVYEIPWPIKGRNQPFLRSQEPIKDQPYFVPVYKYSSNFAYYNPKNRLGPNEVEENSIELDTNLREGNKDIHDKVEPSEFILQLNNEMRKFGIRRRKRKTTTEATHTMFDEENDEEEKDEEDKNVDENEEEEKTKEEEEYTPVTTSKDSRNSNEDTSHTKNSHSHAHRTTHAPTTDAYESSFNCESTDKESNSGCEPSKESLNDNQHKGEASKEGWNHNHHKGEASKEGLNHNHHKGEASKEGLNHNQHHNQHKGEASKEGLNHNQHKGEASKEGLNHNQHHNQHKGEASKEGLNDSQQKEGKASKEGFNNSHQKGEASKEVFDDDSKNDSHKEGDSSKEKFKHSKKKGHTIAEILSTTDEKDLLTNLAKLQALDLPLLRSNVESKVNIYMNVLNDLILEDNKSLKQYDWLTTTVQIQTALSKILKLIKRMKQSKQLYPADLQILRYVVFLYNFSLEIKKDSKLGNKLRKRVKLLPRNKKRRKNKLLKEKGLINRVWLYLRTPLPDLVEDDGFNSLYEFVRDVQDGLYDLHEAIRNIADVTRFDRQNWYSNLKQLYLSTDEKQLRELLLHISMSRLVDLVEHSCKHALDRDFVQFVNTNKKDAKRIVEEMIFINDIVHEITINKE